MRTGNSDHERWDSSTSHNSAPQPQVDVYLADYKRSLRRRRLRFIFLAVLAFGMLCYFTWHR